MKFFKLELNSYEDSFELWFTGEDNLTEKDFGDAVAEAMLEVFRKLGTTVEDSQEVKKDYPLFVLALEEDTFLKVMGDRGFRKLNPDVVVRGDSYSVLWETPEGEKKLTPLKDEGNLERYLLSKGIELSDEDPNKLIFGEF
ncbi:hypothetical protein BCF55_1700 [Hydrogenivirga caldilitoris]|uniref:Uncharacterized protein n=1 Tax=Hydrogenivirga caldilitoris TaxID=246264 RepID=A0A497XR52_9AQUI|nr:hypothetical protein [Hydrogenivirga caldilitoris]RLJ71398.1 hypothetical protein BCF55_1700 [Hydrogenivirga caldilitoris]